MAPAATAAQCLPHGSIPSSEKRGYQKKTPKLPGRKMSESMTQHVTSIFLTRKGGMNFLG